MKTTKPARRVRKTLAGLALVAGLAGSAVVVTAAPAGAPMRCATGYC